MQIRGARRRRTVERGFVLSDHADWPGLNAAIRATRAERVYVTHGAIGGDAAEAAAADERTDAYRNLRAQEAASRRHADATDSLAR